MSERYENKSFHGENKSAQAQVDDPPNSRLFIVGNKKLNESDFREAFSSFGDIEDIWVVKDKRSGESKGVTYIKYGKTSEAAYALESMNGAILPGTDRPIKVMIASSREKGSLREENEDEKIHRLFVLVPKTMTESELQSYFKQFGEVEYVNIVRDRETRESKGFAYIKYYKFSSAATAFENCDRKYRAVFSEPRKPNMSRHNDFGNERWGNNRAQAATSQTSFNSSDSSFGDSKSYKLLISGSPYLTEDQLWKLCNIIPGLEYCQLRYDGNKRHSFGMVVYSSLQWANHACDKLNGFEYPTGSHLMVKPDGTVTKGEYGRAVSSIPYPTSKAEDCNIRKLAETIVQATNIIQSAGLDSRFSKFSSSKSEENVDVFDVKLPSKKPMASFDAECAARCFIIFTPPSIPPPPQALLKDIFCRFGNLIDVYLLNNKSCGYAKYATKDSAMEAIKVLHGYEVWGGRFKVLEAEERSDKSRKRLRLDDN